MNIVILAAATTVELMSRLVAIPSSTANIAEVNRVQTFMAKYLGENGVDCIVETMPTGARCFMPPRAARRLRS